MQRQTIDLNRLDQYLASVSDQEQAMYEADAYGGRLVLRSQVRPDRFWLVDAWTDQRSLESGAIMLRTLSSVAGLVEPPWEIPTEQVRVGRTEFALPRPGERPADAPLPFFLISETRVKPVAMDEYLTMQEEFATGLEEEPGYTRRMLLREVREKAHFLVIDEWASERDAYEAFERRQNAIPAITMTRFLTLLADRGERDFALGIHG